MKKARQPIPIRVEPGESLSPDQRLAVRKATEALRNAPGPLMPILHAVQDELGFIPDGAVSLIAHDLNLTRAEVHGVVSFYHWFRTHAPGKHVVYICRAEACQSRGARAVEAHAKQSLGIDFHQTTADGAISLEPIYCLGNCGCGPSVLVDKDDLHANVTAQSFDALMADLRVAS
ncbi:MAG: formate dehydrogenase subunit gamma [Rudaea sp.]